MKLTGEIIKEIKRALREDVGKGDLTTRAVIPPEAKFEAKIIAHDRGIIAGIEVVRTVFRLLDPEIRFTALLKDGDKARKNSVVARTAGKARAILTGERTALNYLGRLSGIATLTHAFVKKTRPYPAKIYDTRKTTPNLRLLEKYAVRAGGGSNHRRGLYDQVLIKDNHLLVRSAECRARGKSTEKAAIIGETIAQVRKQAPRNARIEIEVENLRQFKAALRAGADIIMLDNMTPSQIRAAVRIKDSFSRRTILEVSGGITLRNVGRFARTGVNMISVGALTHSAPALNFSLEAVEAGR